MISRNAGVIAMGASTMLSRISTLVNYGYGEDLRISGGRASIVSPTKTEGPYTDLQICKTTPLSMLQNDQRNIIQEE